MTRSWRNAGRELCFSEAHNRRDKFQLIQGGLSQDEIDFEREVQDAS
jgi:hypothetical protein